jgi:hypothetical protein
MGGTNVNSPWALLGQLAHDATVKRNMQWSKQRESYQTPLDVPQEIAFRQWLDANQNTPPIRYFDREEPAPDYDMRGFYTDPKRDTLQGVNASDGQIHLNDKYKTPGHQTFSNESQYATPDAPRWSQTKSPTGQTGWTLVDKDGNTLYTEWDR